jgi:hypothetical protein
MTCRNVLTTDKSTSSESVVVCCYFCDFAILLVQVCDAKKKKAQRSQKGNTAKGFRVAGREEISIVRSVSVIQTQLYRSFYEGFRILHGRAGLSFVYLSVLSLNMKFLGLITYLHS